MSDTDSRDGLDPLPDPGLDAVSSVGLVPEFGSDGGLGRLLGLVPDLDLDLGLDRPPGPGLAGFGGDERAIEGLPIRLVIALVVGVASLSVMMNMLSGIQGLAVTELDVRPTPEVVTPGSTTLELEVVGADGETVSGATVVVKGGDARLDGVRTARTGPDGTANVTVAPTLAENREEGTLVVDVKPPAGGGYTDRRGNTKVLVVRE
jgi:hypothetical protein